MESAKAIVTLDELSGASTRMTPRGIVSLCTADHIFIDSLGSQLSGRERLEQAWAGYFSLFPDYRIDVALRLHRRRFYSRVGLHPLRTHHRKTFGAFQLHGAPSCEMDGLPSGRSMPTISQSMSCCPNRPNQSLCQRQAAAGEG